MSQPPGTLHPIPDAQAEMERLAAARTRGDRRVWGVRHPQGGGLGPERISVHVTGLPFEIRDAAVAERIQFDADCEYCDAGARHTLAYRDNPPWRDE